MIINIANMHIVERATYKLSIISFSTRKPRLKRVVLMNWLNKGRQVINKYMFLFIVRDFINNFEKYNDNKK